MMTMKHGNCIPIIGIDRLRMGTDGTGIRTLIGTYGCPLRCKYCLNPQSWNGLTKPKPYTAQQLYDKVRIDNIYFQSTTGGITIGGGEPLLYISGIEEFAALCPKEWSLWTETSLNVAPELVASAAKIFDHFIVDIKTTNAALYKAYTGNELDQAFRNLLYLKDTVGTNSISVRIPQIPGYVDSHQQEQSVVQIASLGFEDIDTFTYKTNIKK